eukprot:SAG11_NODE_301_length_11038_cov_2.312826_1_plen_298_part_10
MRKYESISGITEAAWNTLHLHLDDLVEQGKRELRALIKSRDAVHINEELQKYESYGDALAFERKSVLDHRDKIFKQVVTEMQDFSLRSDVTHMDAHRLLAKYQNYPIDIRKGRDAINLKMRQIFASVADRLLFLMESTSVFEIDMALEEARSIEQSHIDRTGEQTGPLQKEMEKLETHRRELRDKLAKHLVEGVQSEDPRAMQIMLDEARQFGEDLKTEAQELKRRQDTLIATASQDMKALANSGTSHHVPLCFFIYIYYHHQWLLYRPLLLGKLLAAGTQQVLYYCMLRLFHHAAYC